MEKPKEEIRVIKSLMRDLDERIREIQKEASELRGKIQDAQR